MALGIQSRMGQFVGIAPGGSQEAQVTTALNAAANWLAYSIVPSAGGTLNAIRSFLSAKSGTPAAADITAEIQTDSAGLPSGSNVGGGTAQPCTATPASNAWNAWSGFTCSLTAGTMYHVVFKNINGTPASNNVTFRYLNYPVAYPSAAGNVTQSGQASYEWHAATTTNSGGAWTFNSSTEPALRLDWSGGTYEGFPVGTLSQASATVAQSGTEPGVKFTLPGPSSLLYNVAGLGLVVAKSGTPTGVPNLNLYVGASSTTAIPTVAGTTAISLTVALNWLPLAFSTRQQIPGGSVVRVTVANSAADTGSNGYVLGNGLLMDTDSNSLPLAPLQGTMQLTVLSGGAWTDTAGTVPYGALLLDTTGEFSASGGGNVGEEGGLMNIKTEWW